MSPEPKLRECRVCGGKEIDPEGWKNGDGRTGPVCDGCSASADSIAAWNSRAALSVALPMQEPEAWIVEGRGWKRVFIEKEAADTFARSCNGRAAPLYATPAASVAPPITFKNGPVMAQLSYSKFLSWIADRLECVHGENPNYDYMRRLRELAASVVPAEAASVAPAVKVKALEWRGSQGVWAKADALFGATYRITEYAGMPKPFKLETVGFVGPSGHHELLGDAKAAAQADYEQRILSALTSSTASGEDGWRDISSAPKDGTEIDLWARRDGTNRYERVPDCSWQFMSDWDGREFDGWMGLRRGFSRSYVEPTHWRLPPPAPSSSKEDGNAR